jgi:CubicO group peptidase (beta-lactamase class C family)
VDGLPVEEALGALPLPLRAGSTPQQRRAQAAFNVLSTREDALAVTVSGAEGHERSATLVWPGERAVVTPDSPGPLITMERLDSGVGLIRIPTFEEGEHDLVMEFDAALDGLLDAPALIVDLRGNSGGSTHISDPIAGRLMSRPFTYGREHYPARLPQRGWRPWIDYRVQPRGATYTGPVVLLIDEGTFSTAENFVVALVDSGRATTVGRQSGGGSGNPISFRLTGGGRARFSTGDFRRNDGRPIEGQGIAPDVPVTWTVEDLRQGRDPDLVAAEALLSAEGAPEPLDSHALDRLFAEQVRAHAIPGLAVVVVRGDEVAYLRAFGVDGEGLPLTPQTQLQIASLSKSFTALATMQLQEAGQIDLDAPVQTYLPDFTTADPEVGRQITVRQLLNQVSGLSEFGYPHAPPPDADLSTAVADLRRAEPTTPPGSSFAYFNPNYQLLGRIVEVVSGLTYDAYLQANVLGPLGMDRTFATNSQSAALARGENLSRGYLAPFRLPVVAAEPPPILAPSGGLISTAEDLAPYLIMQLNEGQYGGARLASAESVRWMQTPPGGEAGYAMGWYVNEESAPSPVVRHGGSLQTYATSMALLPEEGWGYALLTNHNHALTSLWVMPALEEALVAHLTGTPVPPLPPSTRALGFLLLIVAGVTVTFALLALIRLPRWTVAAPHMAPYKRLFNLITPWLGVLLLALLPRLFSALFDRVVTHAVLFSMAPGVIGSWGIVALLGVLLGGGRLLGWRRWRSVRGQSAGCSVPLSASTPCA